MKIHKENLAGSKCSDSRIQKKLPAITDQIGFRWASISLRHKKQKQPKHRKQKQKHRIKAASSTFKSRKGLFFFSSPWDCSSLAWSCSDHVYHSIRRGSVLVGGKFWATFDLWPSASSVRLVPVSLFPSRTVLITWSSRRRLGALPSPFLYLPPASFPPVFHQCICFSWFGAVIVLPGPTDLEGVVGGGRGAAPPPVAVDLLWNAAMTSSSICSTTSA